MMSTAAYSTGACRRRWRDGVAAFVLAGALAAAETVTVSGITRPFREETLSASVPGTVTKILIAEGDRVTAGQPLIELDRRQEELEVARRKLVWESRAELDSAIAKVAVAKADLEGTRRLFETTKSVSKEELDKKELEYNLSLAERRQFETDEARERIEYEMAQEQLRRRTLTAPAAGSIVRKRVEEGENCEPRQPLLNFVDVSKCYFVASADVRAASLLKVGQEVDLEVETGSGPVACKGRVSLISPVVDAASGLQEVKVLFDNPDGRVRPGVAAVMKVVSPAHD